MASIINAATSGGLISTADTSGILQLQTASTTAVTVNASQNVGIGTASPASKLHIVSTTLPQLRVEFNSSYYTTLSNNGTLNVVDSGTSNKWVFQRNGTEQAIIDPSGNLGLGVTPSAWDTGIALKAFQFSATGCVYGYSFISILVVLEHTSQQTQHRSIPNPLVSIVGSQPHQAQQETLSPLLRR
jgi:hypothetical protein